MVEHYISLQFLRACAAWLVVFHHYSQMYRDFEAITFLERLFTDHGHLGVDIFFVLSGFIMGLSLTNRQKTAGSFALDRVIRIAPAYWIATMVLLVAIQLPLWENIEFLKAWGWRELIYSLLFIPHQHSSGLGLLPVLTVGWTLNYEMFFYGLLALSLLISSRYSLLIALITVITLPLLNAMGLDLGPIAGSFLIYEFSFGLLIFLLAVKVGQINKRSFSLQTGLAVICLLVALTSFKLQFYRFDMVVAATLVLGCVCGEAVFRKLPKLVISAFVHLGNLSYSTYLLHVPAIVFVGVWVDRSRDNDPMLILLTVCATYLMSYVSYLFVEQRLSKALKKVIASRQTAATY